MKQSELPFVGHGQCNNLKFNKLAITLNIPNTYLNAVYSVFSYFFKFPNDIACFLHDHFHITKYQIHQYYIWFYLL